MPVWCACVRRMSYPTSQLEQNCVLYARMQNARNLLMILKAINFKEVGFVQVCDVTGRFVVFYCHEDHLAPLETSTIPAI